MSGDDIVVTGAGLVTSLAWDVRQCCAAVMAGVSSFQEIEHFATAEGDAAAGGIVEGFTSAHAPADRFFLMASAAIREAVGVTVPSRELPSPERSALFLCLPMLSELDGDAFLESLRGVLEEEGLGRPAKSSVLRGGHAIGIRAIRQAMRNLGEETIDCAIVGGVDSHVHRRALQALEKAGRLKTANHPEGLIPGESAAFVVLERESTVERGRGRVLAKIRSSGYVSGEATRESGDPIRGIVLAEAIRKSLRRSDETSPFDLVLCDLNGERVRMMEWALARNRILAGLEIDPPISHPAECWGDLGAASSIALLATGAIGVAEEWIPKRNVLVWSASDDGDRGSIALHAGSRSGDPRRPSAPGKVRRSIRLWKSHSEEAAYLYEVRHPERAHWQTEWEDYRRWEERLNPHLRALLLGGFDCAQFVRERYLDDEDAWAGEKFVAAWVCASVESIETMQWVANALDAGGPGRAALLHALVRSPRPDLENWVRDFLDDRRAGVRLAGIEVAARRAMAQHRPLIEKLAEDPDASVAAWAAVTAAAWEKKRSWEDVFEKCSEIEDAFVLRKVLIELLRRGETRALEMCRELSSSDQPRKASMAQELLAAAGGRRDRSESFQKMSAGEMTADALLAAAFMGSAKVALLFLEHLMSSERDVFRAAVQGLRLLSGEASLPAFDFEDATDEQRHTYRDFWNDWWKTSQKKMSEHEMWRRGRPMSPAVLVEDLTWPGHPNRELAGLQLCVRYGFPEEFRLHHEFTRMSEIVRQGEAWAQTHRRDFSEGRGYFAGAMEPARGDG